MSAKRELVPLGWERNTHTSSRRALSLSPPPASTSSTTTTSSSPPTPAGLRKRFSRTSTWLLHFEAAPRRLYRPGSSLGNVVQVPGRAGAWGCAEGLQVPESPWLRGWVLNRLPRADPVVWGEGRQAGRLGRRTCVRTPDSPGLGSPTHRVSPTPANPSLLTVVSSLS